MNRKAAIIFSIVMLVLVAGPGEARPVTCREAWAACSKICFKPSRPFKETGHFPIPRGGQGSTRRPWRLSTVPPRHEIASGPATATASAGSSS
jgi:hypothetical protein